MNVVFSTAAFLDGVLLAAFDEEFLLMAFFSPGFSASGLSYALPTITLAIVLAELTLVLYS